MLDPTKIAIRATTQEHLDIEDIKDDLVILKDGSCCLVVATTAINFGLLSEKEQEATIYAYAGLLNSLNFSIQLVIRSKRKDVSAYLKLLDEAEAKEKKALIREQIQKYKDFIRETVQRNEVLDKKFYLVIPMSALELGVTKTITATLRPRKGLPFDKNYILEKGKVNLYPKRDHLLRLLARIGLKGHQLTTQELIQLFFDIYNPEVTGQQVTGAKQYETPFVQPVTPALPEALKEEQAETTDSRQVGTSLPQDNSLPPGLVARQNKAYSPKTASSSQAAFSPKVASSSEAAYSPKAPPASIGRPEPPISAGLKPTTSFPPEKKERTIQDQISDLVKNSVKEEGNGPTT